MISFRIKNKNIAKEWIQKLFADKKFYPSMIYRADEAMMDAIIKYEDDPFAWPTLMEDQFEDVFSKFKDDNILVVSDFTVYLKDEQFFDEVSKIERSFGIATPNGISLQYRCPIAFAISKDIFTYDTYLGIIEQFSYIAFVDQKSGRTLIALPELNFLIYP